MKPQIYINCVEFKFNFRSVEVAKQNEVVRRFEWPAARAGPQAVSQAKGSGIWLLLGCQQSRLKHNLKHRIRQAHHQQLWLQQRLTLAQSALIAREMRTCMFRRL